MDPNPPAKNFRWSDLDQAIVSPKLSKLTSEMQEAFTSDEAEISFEGRKRGNSGYFLPTFLDKQVRTSRRMGAPGMRNLLRICVRARTLLDPRISQGCIRERD